MECWGLSVCRNNDRLSAQIHQYSIKIVTSSPLCNKQAGVLRALPDVDSEHASSIQDGSSQNAGRHVGVIDHGNADSPVVRPRNNDAAQPLQRLVEAETEDNHSSH